jgi:predicted transcriptional regulator
MEEDLLALGRRRMIFEHIGLHPGTYLREMETALGLSVGDLQYHLGQLEKGTLIYAHDDGRRKGYFVTDQVQYFDKGLLALLRMRTPRRIVLHLLLHPDSTFREILAQFRFTKGALSFHLKRLVKAGVIIKGRQERESIFKVADEERVKNLLITYRTSMADEVLDGVVDVLTKI